MRVSRRGLIAGAAAGGALVVAWALFPRSYSSPLPPGKDEQAFNAWLKIARDGVVTVALPQLEMGQGVATILAQVIATELGADWRQVGIEPVPVSGAYANTVLAEKWSMLWTPALAELAAEPGNIVASRFAQATRFTATADGTSLAAYEAPCRDAAAMARAMLIAEAAARWDVEPDECHSANGFVIHARHRARFAELVERAAARTPPAEPPLRPDLASEVPLAGGSEQATDFPRLDLPAKVDGSQLFAGDVRLPDMVYAAIKHGPVAECELTHFEAGAVAGNRRVVAVVKGKRWLAAVATDWWSADRAVEAMEPRFKATGLAESERDAEALAGALRQRAGDRIALRGTDDAFATGPDFARRYDVEPALHLPLETASATARLADGRLELWLASQAPERARQAVIKALGLADEQVVLYPMPAGGSFDARLEHQHAIEAALIAREVSPRPVQLVYSRWQEILTALPRTPVTGLLWANLREGGGGAIEALKARIAAPASAREFGERLFDNKTVWAARRAAAGLGDAMVTEGLMPPYTIPNVAIDHVPVTISHGTGRLRGNAHSYTAFFVESFIDEIAAFYGREPLSYRVELLSGDLRMVDCLQRAARLAQWDGGRDHSGQGLACHRIGDADSGGRIACIATARRDEGGVRVSKISAAVDIGRIVNLDIARQQIEGGLVFGLSLALGANLTYAGGMPVRQRLAEFELPVLADCPEIEIELVASEAEPFDPGELGVAVCPPAIANALFSATGLRFRRLPLLSEGL